MSINPQLQNVTGDDIAEEPNEHAIAVVGIGFPLPETLTIRTGDLHAFVELYNISRATPFMNMRLRAMFTKILAVSEDKQTTVNVSRFCPLAMSVGEVPLAEPHRQIVDSLSGQKWIIINQTFNELRFDSDDIQDLPLSTVERFFLNSALRWYRLRGVPLLIHFDLAGGRRRLGCSRLSFPRRLMVNFSTPIHGRVIFSWAGSLISRLLRRAK